MRIAELLTEAEFREKRRMMEMEAERLQIQEKLAKSQAKFKIYKDLDQMSQKAGKIEVQQDKGNSEHKMRHVQLLTKQTAITRTKKHLYHFFTNQIGNL